MSIGRLLIDHLLIGHLKKSGFLLLTILFCSCSATKPFKMVLMPDTQTYSRLHPEVFYAQTRWITEHTDSIVFVLHQGDITDNNVVNQWEVASTAMHALDGKVPYAFVTGNHDLNKNSDIRDSELFNHYFPYDKYSKEKQFGGAYQVGKMDNTWHTFKAGGINWLVVCLEFGPRNCVMEWADWVIKQHPKCKVIINTHAYMYSDDTRMGDGDDWLPQGYGVGKATGKDAVNNGEQMWDKLVSKYPNIMFVFSGHVLHRGTGTLVSTGINGNKVYQMLANYQGGVDGPGNGKDGYLRILTIDPEKKKIDIKTYSPFLKTYKTENYQQFAFENVSFK